MIGHKLHNIWLAFTCIMLEFALAGNYVPANAILSSQTSLIDAVGPTFHRYNYLTAVVTFGDDLELDFVSRIAKVLPNAYYLVNVREKSENIEVVLSKCTLYIMVCANRSQNLRFLAQSVRKGILSPRALFIIVSLSPIGTQEKLNMTKDHFLPAIPRLLYFQPSFRRPHLLIQVHQPISSAQGTRLCLTNSWDGQTFLDATFSWGTATKSWLSLHGKPLRVCTFPFPPSVIQTSPGNFSGIDIGVIEALAQFMNFTPIFYHPPAGKWGILLPNGSWDGLMGEIISGQADMGVANLFMTRDRLANFEMSFPFDSACATFITSLPPPFPQWQALVLPFQFPLWLATIFSVVLSGLSLFWAANLYHWVMRKPAGPFQGNLGVAFLYSLQSLFGIGGPEDRSTWPIRCYGSFLWISYMVLTADYRAALTAYLSVPTTPPPIDSLRQLLDSGLQWGGSSTEMGTLFAMSLEPNARQIGLGYTVLPLDQAINRTARGLFATMENRQHVDFLRNTEYLDAYGRPTLHGMKECLNSFPIAIALPKKSVYIERVNEIVQKLGQTGLVPYWLELAIRSAHSASTHLEQNQGQSENLVFSLYHLQGAFYCLGLGSVPAILAFLAERFCYRAMHRRENF